MSQLIPEVFQQQYDAEVKRSYGQKMQLKDKVYLKTGVEGDKVWFRKKGKGMATEHIRSAQIRPMNVKYEMVSADMKNYDAFDYIDKMDLKKFNFSEAQETAEVASDAIGLKLDQIVIDAISNGYDKTNRKIGTGEAALTVADLRKACKFLNKAGVENKDRVCLHTAEQLDALLGTTEVTSSDYNSVKALTNGEMNKFLNLEFILIADRAEGGLPHTASTETAFVYHKRAVGLGISQDIQTRMDWISDRSSWLVGGDFAAGAAVIDKDGIVAIVTKLA